MPVAPYDTEKYRAWNRERMREVREDWEYAFAEGFVKQVARFGQLDLSAKMQEAADELAARAEVRWRGAYTRARDPNRRGMRLIVNMNLANGAQEARRDGTPRRRNM